MWLVSPMYYIRNETSFLHPSLELEDPPPLGLQSRCLGLAPGNSPLRLHNAHTTYNRSSTYPLPLLPPHLLPTLYLNLGPFWPNGAIFNAQLLYHNWILYGSCCGSIVPSTSHLYYTSKLMYRISLYPYKCQNYTLYGSPSLALGLSIQTGKVARQVIKN